MHFETNVTEFLVIHEKTAIKKECRLLHAVVNLFVIIGLEFIPFSQNANSMSSLAGFVWIRRSGHEIVKIRSIVVVDTTSVVHFFPHFLTGNLWVINMNLGVFLQQIPNNEHRWGFSNVTRVLLESVSHNRNLLPRDSVEHGRYNFSRESLLLEIIHGNHLTPIFGTRMQSVCFTQIHEVQNILLETRSSKSYRGLQKALPNAVIHTNRTADFCYICTCNFTQS
mmetsp:Transcript_26545/g.62380  ORF Transcript_26545/g.62380 Transcript_26545/m.62380 type:complete len:224 (-) Transcript_26545:912-1583(-)